MAIVTYNRSVHSFHGSVGRLVFYERNGQRLLRSKGKRTAPRSGAQLVSQKAFGSAAARWTEFSVGEKEPWRLFGKQEGITGYNAFLRVNIPRLKLGLPADTDAPAPDAGPGEGCRRFMEEMRLMVLRVSRECRVRTGAVRSATPGPY